jgi:hypothetical protein
VEIAAVTAATPAGNFVKNNQRLFYKKRLWLMLSPEALNYLPPSEAQCDFNAFFKAAKL